jgi:BMFP domain-containing protein YqiC
MAQDYILRLIEQVGQMLAEISRLRKAEIPQRIRAICQQTIGLSLDLVKRSSPEMILKLLESGGGTHYARAVSWRNCFYKMQN